MDAIYGLIPAMILLALVSAVVFYWAARSGQYEDMEGPAHRILSDDDDPMLPWIEAENKQNNHLSESETKKIEGA